MANKYDPPAMKQAANSMEQELKQFRSAKNAILQTLSSLRGTNFQSSVADAFQRVCKQEAVPAMEDMEALISDFASLFHACAKKYGAAIDNGNANLSG